MATFNSVTIIERGQSGIMVPVHGASGNVGARAKPRWAESVVIDRGGTTLAVLSMPVACGSTTLDDLRFAVGNSDSLIYSGGTVTALLAELKDAQKVKDSADTFFATLDFVVCTANTTIQEIDIDCVIGGNAYDGQVLEATISHGVDQASGQAQVVFPSRPADATEGGSVSIALGVGGANAPMFAGTVTGRAWEHWPTGVAIDCRDRMEYLTYPYGGTERTYAAATLGTVWQNLGEAQGIASANMSIEDPGWTVAITEPLVFRRGDKFLPWMQESMSLAGYCIFTKGADSAVYVRPFDENVTGAGTHTLTEGVNLLSARRDITRDGILNGVQVDGLTYLGASVSVYMATANSDVRSPPGTVAGFVQSNLIETDTRASAVGSTFLDHHNFKPESYTFTLPGTAIEPMDMLVVTHADLELTGATVTATQVEQRFSSSGYVTTVQAKRVTR